ncbi:hypothetical protein [Limnoglobus roseus]|uniref:Uncharacterized protein n=1 Tax=Limnoglobus roseus TaxID=2598579 RepID=A0A5C1AAK3_9BACT|nr:hypothetical protein [Limnoglobus roseus]QEL14144.1 hypothetical protein PX52LOC_01014 [Limnoglobus roseus]
MDGDSVSRLYTLAREVARRLPHSLDGGEPERPAKLLAILATALDAIGSNHWRLTDAQRVTTAVLQQSVRRLNGEGVSPAQAVGLNHIVQEFLGVEEVNPAKRDEFYRRVGEIDECHQP